MKKIRDDLVRAFNNIETNPFQVNLIRIYYYDAIVEKGHPDYDKQVEYFDDLECCYLTVKLDELVESSKEGFRQKGIDILMVIDALTKAYQDEFDVAIFLLGDRDFIPFVDAVKDTGKKTLMICDISNSAPELRRQFDTGLQLGKSDIENWLRNEPSVRLEIPARTHATRVKRQVCV